MPPIARNQENYIKISLDRVIEVETWVICNGKPFATIYISRTGNEFFVSGISDPEHGEGVKQGNIDEVLSGLHPEVATKYKNLFDLFMPTEEKISKVGFSGYKIYR